MTRNSRLKVTRAWLTAFSATAMGMPLAVFSLCAFVMGAGRQLNVWMMWLALLILVALVASFAWLSISRDRFCRSPFGAQQAIALFAVVLVVVGYALFLFLLNAAIVT
jgi:hypothetical protein